MSTQNLPLLSPKSRPDLQVDKWATVTQASPLRIKIDGESVAIPFTPDSLLGPLAVNDRVLVTLLTNQDLISEARRLIVKGRVGGQLIAHTHPASDIASGTLAIARIPTGTTSSTVSLGDHQHAQSVYLSSDQTMTQNSTTQQDVTALVLPVAANAKYLVEVHAIVNVFANAGVDSSFTYPSAASLMGYVLGPQGDSSGVGATSGYYYTIWNRFLGIDSSSPSSDLATGGLSQGTAWDVPHIFRGHLVTGANSGNLQFRCAQTVAQANDLIVRAGSWMSLIRAS